jgi:hypothetical protein
MHQALGVDPTESVLADVELPRVVADHHRLAQEPMCFDRPRWCTNPWDSTVASLRPARSRNAKVSGTRGRMAALSPGR